MAWRSQEVPCTDGSALCLDGTQTVIPVGFCGNDHNNAMIRSRAGPVVHLLATAAEKNVPRRGHVSHGMDADGTDHAVAGPCGHGLARSELQQLAGMITSTADCDHADHSHCDGTVNAPLPGRAGTAWPSRSELQQLAGMITSTADCDHADHSHCDGTVIAPLPGRAGTAWPSGPSRSELQA
jgi:hypothetical protein